MDIGHITFSNQLLNSQWELESTCNVTSILLWVVTNKQYKFVITKNK